jgi:DNA-binding MarR family transcriptional regulator
MNAKRGHPNFEKCGACACFNLRKASRALTRFFDKTMQPGGVRGTQFSILVTLSVVGLETVTRLSERLVMDRTTLTRNLRPLEKRGLIHLSQGEDKRTRTVALTPRGRKALADAYPHWETAQIRIMKKLGRKRFQSLLRDLSEISSLFSEAESPR